MEFCFYLEKGPAKTGPAELVPTPLNVWVRVLYQKYRISMTPVWTYHLMNKIEYNVEILREIWNRILIEIWSIIPNYVYMANMCS